MVEDREAAVRAPTFRLEVDDAGRARIPEVVRAEFDVEGGATLPARIDDGVLTVELRPSARIRTATAGRDDWSNSTPTDAGRSLFGSLD